MPELRPEFSAAQEMVFTKGTNAGLLAQQLFPGGKDASPADHFSYPKAIRQTFDWISKGEKIIYEAAFQYDRVMATWDILSRKVLFIYKKIYLFVCSNPINTAFKAVGIVIIYKIFWKV